MRGIVHFGLVIFFVLILAYLILSSQNSVPLGQLGTTTSISAIKAFQGR